ncbi:DUF262 domain-containing protein [Rothia sp. ND6WE1A]|uniref:DUF262 domain-containing protein n=1 Tax=Rothia sp. ND6WE1A TaxID=1848190 RepID=UPI00082CC8C2|nr:DUF262 domain-containing protein [Rothia sp. ND6WE1A]
MNDLTVRQIIEKVQNGQLRIPAFQRGFVWDPDQVAYLMDSIYKGYPFGSVILWRTRTQLNTERNLGPFELPNPEEEFPVDYVLDGQQRLTSIFGVFQNDIVAVENEDSSWTQIYYDFESPNNIQESKRLIQK